MNLAQRIGREGSTFGRKVASIVLLYIICGNLSLFVAAKSVTDWPGRDILLDGSARFLEIQKHFSNTLEKAS